MQPVLSRLRSWMSSLRRRFSALRPGTVALVCVGIYVSGTVLTVMIAHALLVLHPESSWAGRIITPVARGLEFLDAHWKSVLILVAPFFGPVARSLVPRLRRVGSIEFDPIPLEPVAVRDKPPRASQE